MLFRDRRITFSKRNDILSIRSTFHFKRFITISEFWYLIFHYKIFIFIRLHFYYTVFTTHVLKTIKNSAWLVLLPYSTGGDKRKFWNVYLVIRIFSEIRVAQRLWQSRQITSQRNGSVAQSRDVLTHYRIQKSRRPWPRLIDEMTRSSEALKRSFKAETRAAKGPNDLVGSFLLIPDFEVAIKPGFECTRHCRSSSFSGTIVRARYREIVTLHCTPLCRG